jgi:hypothetical protein
MWRNGVTYVLTWNFSSGWTTIDRRPRTNPFMKHKLKRHKKHKKIEPELEREKRRFEIYWWIWIELKPTSLWSRIFINDKINNNNKQTANYEDALLLKIRKFAFSPKISWKYHSLNVYYLSSELLRGESKHPRTSFSSCCCSLSVTVTVCQSNASFSHSKSLSQIQNIHDPINRLKLRFLRFIKELRIGKFTGCWKMEY